MTWYGKRLLPLVAIAVMICACAGTSSSNRQGRPGGYGEQKGPLIEEKGRLVGLVAGGSLWTTIQGKQTYALLLSQRTEYNVPPEDRKTDGSIVFREAEYLVKGYRVRTLSTSQGDIPVLQVIYFEKYDKR